MLEAEERLEGARSAGGSPETCFFEVTVASVDQPKLLSRLSECLVRARATRHLAGGHARCSPSQTAARGTPTARACSVLGPSGWPGGRIGAPLWGTFWAIRWSPYAKWREYLPAAACAAR